MIELMRVKLKRFANQIGVDKAIFFTVLGRAWGVGSGLLTIVFVTRFMSPEEQGYYYTFYSIIALQTFVELGLNYAIIQFASHEMANLTWTPEGTVTGNAESKRRLQSLLHFALIWFCIAGLLMIAVLLPLGLHFFETASQQNSTVLGTAAPWSLLVVFAAVNLVITAAVAVLEGCGKVAQVAILRLAQSFFSSVLVWIVLSLGGHLYALAANSLMVALVGLASLWGRYRTFFKDLFSHRTPLPGMNWRLEIWPFQWRIAISWMSGYLSFQIFNPLLFATHGPVAAGQMGMSLQIIGAMSGVAMAWITTKAPTYGKLIAQNQLKTLNELFSRGLRQSFLILIVGVTVGLIALWYLAMLSPKYAQRVLPFHLMIFLCLTTLANHIAGAQGAYLRAYKKDPFMPLSIISGTATAVLSIILIPSYGAEGAVIVYLLVSTIIGLIGGTTIFINKRNELMYG